MDLVDAFCVIRAYKNLGYPNKYHRLLLDQANKALNDRAAKIMLEFVTEITKKPPTEKTDARTD